MTEIRPTVDTVVMTDLHGRADSLEQVVEHYGENVRYVIAGDSIGRGPNSAGVLDIAEEIDARLTWGNWELFFMAGLVHHDDETRKRVQNIARYFELEELRPIAASYDVDTHTPRAEIIDDLTKHMQAKGHLNLLARAAMYFETEEFIAIHAGLTPDKSWGKQKEDLAIVKGTFEELPQIVDDAQFRLARREQAFEATNKIVITGHAHHILGNRITARGKRVRLASKVNEGQSLYVWQSWDRQLREFPSV